jgi:tetratricopeptide (TPR) repeat protein
MGDWRSSYLTVLILTAVAVAVGGFATLFSVFVSGQINDPEEVMRVATAELAAERFSIAKGLAESVQVDPEENRELYASRQFLIGSARVELALQELDRRRKVEALQQGVELLQEAAAEGALTDLRGRQGNRLLGLAHYDLGNYPAAHRHLAEACRIDPTLMRKLLPLLIRSQIRDSEVPAEVTLRRVEELLRFPDLKLGERVDGLLLGSVAWKRDRRWSEAQEYIDQANRLQPNNHRVVLADAELHLEEIQANYQRMQDATTALEEILATARRVARVADLTNANRANFLGAKVLRALDRSQEAIDLLTRIRQDRDLMFQSPAGIEALELLAKTLKGDELLVAAKQILKETGDPITYEGTLLPFDVFRSRLLGVAEGLLKAGQHEIAIELTKIIVPTVPAADAMSIAGNAWEDWAERGAQSKEISEPEVRRRFREAGKAFEAAAKLRFTEKDYTARIWRAIEAYLAGDGFRQCLPLLDDYLRYAPRGEHPRALMAQGRSYMATEKIPAALQVYEACLAEHATDPIRYEARLRAAQANSELGRYAAARELLETNLYEEVGPIPDSPIWRDSLFSLGELLYQQAQEIHLGLTRPKATDEPPQPNEVLALTKILEEAIDKLETADERYSASHRRGRLARHLAAHAHRMSAYWPEQELKQTQLADSLRRDYLAKRRAHYEAGIAHLVSLQKELGAAEESERLEPREELMLRGSYLSQGDMYFALEDYEKALDAYAGAALRYSSEPISLEASARQARCYLALRQPQNANRAYLQAAQNLQRMGNAQDMAFDRTTRHDRQGWEKMFQWMNQN